MEVVEEEEGEEGEEVVELVEVVAAVAVEEGLEVVGSNTSQMALCTH